MQHPTPERLAELADGIPEMEEANHLVECARCAREVESFRRLGGMAAHLGAPESQRPLTDWDSLSARLRDEGVIRPQPATAAGAMGVVRRGAWRRSWMALRIAAGLLLFVSGAIAGRWLVPAPLDRPSAARSIADGDTVTFASLNDARDMLERAQREYQVAAAYLAANMSLGSGDADLIRTRLAALDAVAGVVREAIDEAPFDPVINQYYISTLEARQATLHQLASALPVGTQMSRF